MRRFSHHTIALVAAVVLGIAPGVVSSQSVQRSTAIASSDVLSLISMFNYRDRRKSDLILRPTPVIATGEGDVEVEYDDGNAEIEAEVRKLPPPTSLGPYTSYVLWALTPDGRFANQGVLAGAAGGRGSLQTQYGASQFALIVTAEPHFAVSAPSSMVVLYNVADNVKGNESKVTSLTERADYSSLAPIEIDERTRPVEVVQAEYALAIAMAEEAEQYASQLYQTAQAQLVDAQMAARSRKSSVRKTAPSLAREAVITGEDARRAAMVARAVAQAEQARQEAAEKAAAAERERAAVAAAEAARQADLAAQERARKAAAEAEARAIEQARADLLNRLNFVLPTRESTRGLVSEVGGVQFATARAELGPTARETLAKFSGIVASYPGLTFVIEGHTDSTGSDVTNRELSWQRAISVRDYLIGQGVAASRIDVQGFGSAQPVADNTTEKGRARNRRVEIIISGGLLASN